MISVESLNTTNVEFTQIKSQHYHYLFIYLAVLADVFCILACATALACVAVRCRRLRFKHRRFFIIELLTLLARKLQMILMATKTTSSMSQNPRNTPNFRVFPRFVHVMSVSLRSLLGIRFRESSATNFFYTNSKHILLSVVINVMLLYLMVYY